MTDAALKRIWEKVDKMIGPQRMETDAEHIARDMREGRFPERSDPIQVPVNPKPETMADLITAEALIHRMYDGPSDDPTPLNRSEVEVIARTVIALHAQLADAQTAQADARTRIGAKAREFAAHYPVGSDGRNTFIVFAEWIEETRL